jgi:hypothetical protein
MTMHCWKCDVGFFVADCFENYCPKINYWEGSLLSKLSSSNEKLTACKDKAIPVTGRGGP